MTIKAVDVGLQYSPATGHTTQAGYWAHAAQSGIVVPQPCQIIGFYANNTSAGTIQLLDTVDTTNLTNVITAISQAASAVVTVSTVSGANPFFVGQVVGFSGIVGMTQMNGLTGVVTAIGGASGAWTITVNINSTAFTAYSSGGVATKGMVSGLITPAIGMQWFPAIFLTGLYALFGGTSLDVTFFYVK